jgi:GPH family glycoside/pentoside/hexuronide:cation symporter
VLNAVGFDVALKADQAPSTITAMRLFLSVAPALAAIACILLLKNYPLNRARADEIRAQLERRRGAV